MFEYNFRRIRDDLLEASQYYREAVSIRTSGPFGRFFQEALIDRETGERVSERQARLDERKQELLSSVGELLNGVATEIIEICNWFSEKGYNGRYTYEAFCEMLGDCPDNNRIQRVVNWLQGFQFMVEAIERAEAEEEAAEEDLRSIVGGIASRYGMNSRLVVRRG
jgi:hypothetical protein